VLQSLKKPLFNGFRMKTPMFFFIGNLAGALATGVWSATSMLLTPMLG
jgi:hypothetical protein